MHAGKKTPAIARSFLRVQAIFASRILSIKGTVHIMASHADDDSLISGSMKPLATLFRRKSSELVSRKRKRPDSDDSHSVDNDSGNDVSSDSVADLAAAEAAKEQARLDAERERSLDDAIPEYLRKYRPLGYSINLPPSDRPVRIYADGVFDLFHLGHMKQLEQAKHAFPSVTLVCGVPSDIETHKRKGLTVLTDVQRCETLTHCKWVDEVIPDAPWCVTTDFVEEHMIDYIAHDDLPYALGDSDDIYKPIKERGMFLTTQRTDGILTSDIITKIIRDYDKYLVRNFARGATRKELNVSWLKKNELELKKHVADFRLYWKKNSTNLNNVSRDLYSEMRDYMRGKKVDLQSLLDLSGLAQSLMHASDSEEGIGRLPMSDFAAKYIGNRNARLNARSSSKSSLLSNVKDWMKRDEGDERSFAGSSDLGLVRSAGKRYRRIPMPVMDQPHDIEAELPPRPNTRPNKRQKKQA